MTLSSRPTPPNLPTGAKPSVAKPPVAVTAPRIERVTLDGRDALTLSNDRVSVTTVPDRGARITSLLDRTTGHEWMWRPTADVRLPARTTADAFDDSPLVGADECIPTVGFCTIDDATYPDHGGAWSDAWTPETDESRATVTTSLDLRCAPLRITRVMSLAGATLTLAYEVINRSSRAVPWLWCWHPLFNIPKSPKLALNGFSPAFRYESGEGVPAKSAWPWPKPHDGIDLAALDLGGTPRSVKLFADRETSTASAVISDTESGSRLTIDASSRPLTGLGLWISRGGWNGHHHFAVEPCTVPFETPEGAAKAQIGPGAEVRFELPITLGHSFH